MFDPLGIASPFLLECKLILQEIVAEKRDWDDELTQNQVRAWSVWREELSKLAVLKVSRCYKSSALEVVDVSLHCFSDASEKAYGQACYIRQIDIEGNISVSLVMPKSKVAPLKSITIPRLELVAALFSGNISVVVREELKLKGLQCFFWTANRVQKLRNISSPAD